MCQDLSRFPSNSNYNLLTFLMQGSGVKAIIRIAADFQFDIMEAVA